MQSQCVVAVYSSRNDAEQAYREVLDSGVPEDHVRLTDQQRTQGSGSEGGSIWDWLFGSDMPEGDRHLYDERMASGGTVLSVLVDSPSIANVEQIEGLLERHNPVEVHDEAGGTAMNAGSSANQQRRAIQGSQGTQTEEVIPLPEEELNVGKRATERVQRIRTYVVEQPVEKDVQLRDERIVVERRPASGAQQAIPAEREVEVHELHEEPVVQKQVRAGEELVVHKEGTERTERIADSVKKTEADIGKSEPAERDPRN